MTQKNKTVFSIFWENMRGYRFWSFLTAIVVVGATGFELAAPLFYKKFFDLFADQSISKERLAHGLVTVAFLIFFIHAGAWLFSTIQRLITVYVEPHVMAKLDQSSFAYMIHHSYQFFTDHFAGSLSRRIQRLSRGFEDIYDSIREPVIPLVITLTGSILILLLHHRTIGLIILTWTIVIFIFNYFFSRWKLKHDLARAAQDSKVSATMVDALANAMNIKLFTGYAYEENLVRKVTNEFTALRIFGWGLGQISDAVQILLMFLVELLLTYVAIQFWKRGQLTIGDFAMFQGYILIIFGQLSGFRQVIRRLYESYAESQEMVDILNEPHEIQDTKTAKSLVVKQGAVEFKDVTFHYHKTRTILDHLNLKIKPQEKVALVGSSGAGKSTVMKLLFRFYDIDGGKILIDNQPISKATQDSLRDHIALVPQEPVLFHRTLMENIRYGRREATDEEVIEAAKKAYCHEFITTLPDRYETQVGERGIKLSGGERQRVAIARAILKDAPILLLDEATSSLDSESESLIQDALWQLMKNKTVIAIAHRLSTIMEMDRIVVMDQGKVVDSGTHEMLLKKNGIYKTLWEIQAGGFLP